MDVNKYLRLLFITSIFDPGMLFSLFSLFEQSGEEGDSEQQLCRDTRCSEIPAKAASHPSLTTKETCGD